MMDQIPKIEELIENLSNKESEVRLESLRQLTYKINSRELKRPETNGFVNNHIHTIYSFSPYSPAKAVWQAYNSGLSSAGIIDHDSISGACEFIEAGRMTGIATTIGFELRVDFSKTKLNDRKINNPDQDSIGYVTIHGIPHNKINEVKKFLSPINKARNIRNKLMIDKINEIIRQFEISVNFDEDVYPISMADEGGSITERHILFAFLKKMILKFGKGEKLVNFLKDKLKIDVSNKFEQLLLDKENPFYAYDLLGILKSDMVKQFYINATDECPPVKEAVTFADSIGAIIAYAYLGDIEESVTGDKKRQKFEDEYIDLLFNEIDDIGFKALTYMPSRNSIDQLKKVKSLCSKYNFLEISGEDINNPRQVFICKALMSPLFKNLIDTTWAVIGHEKTAALDINNGFFSSSIIKQYPDINKRIEYFKEIGIK